MKFYHYTNKPFEHFKTPLQRLDFKPNGVWFSCNKEWKEFSEKEYRYQYEAILDKSALITLSTYKEIKEFTDHYGVPYDKWILIDWRKVAKEYSGIYIKRLDPIFYGIQW